MTYEAIFPNYRSTEDLRAADWQEATSVKGLGTEIMKLQIFFCVKYSFVTLYLFNTG